MGGNYLPFAWCLANLIQGVIIILGNFLAIVVFWRRRSTLKRTSYLLINLAVADLLVGVGETGLSIGNFFENDSPSEKLILQITDGINVVSISASIYSLVVIAIERAFAILTPLRHRTAKTWCYIYAVILVWLLAALNFTLTVVQIFCSCIGNDVILRTLASLFLTSLLVICSSYATIWCFASKRLREVQSRQLAMTLCIMTFLSLLTLVPGQVILMIMEHALWIPVNISSGYFFAWLMLFSNSLINPFLYALRMPEFRNELKVMCRPQIRV